MSRPVLDLRQELPCFVIRRRQMISDLQYQHMQKKQSQTRRIAEMECWHEGDADTRMGAIAWSGVALLVLVAAAIWLWAGDKAQSLWGLS